MIKRRELMLGVLLSGLTRGTVLAAEPATSAPEVPKNFDDATGFTPDALVKRIQSCMDDAYAAMDKAGQKFITHRDGSVNCNISAFGNVTVNAGGASGKLYINMNPDGAAQVQLIKGGKTNDITESSTGQIFQKGIQDEFEKRSKVGVAPGW